MLDGILRILGSKGLIIIIGFAIFLFSYRHSQSIFDWVEKQTFGTRTFILEHLELLFIEVKPDHITYLLLFLSVGLSLITLTLVGVFASWTIGVIVAIVVAFIGFKIPKPIMRKMVKARHKQYSGQMVDGLTLLSNGIRAGLSLPQSLAMVVDEMPAPISQEFGLILQQNKIGVPLEECFDNLAKRVPLQDNDMFVSSINILRETGGNLAETFDTIVGVIRERVRLKQKIDQLTASGLFQGYVIAAMPFAIGLIYYVSDPESMMPLFTTPLGWVAMGVAFMFDMAGLFIIMKIVKIEA